MIQKLLYSNDKSTVQVMPKNYKDWFSFGCPYWEHSYAFSRFFFLFGKYMEGKASRVINSTHKYSVEFYFPYFMIRQLRRANSFVRNGKECRSAVFNFYIHFNYIQYLNKSGFNYIKYSSEFEELKPFVQDIIELYLSHLSDFVQQLHDKWDELTDSKGNYLKDKYGLGVVYLFERYVIDQFRDNSNVAISDLSVTLDIHFKDVVSKKIFFNAIKNLKQEHYKMFIVEDETVFLNPYNRIYEIKDKNYPKIRFYDKQKDLFYRYKQKLKGEGYLIGIEDKNLKRIFTMIDKFSHSENKKNLEQDFIEGYVFLNNVIRFEVDFGKKSLDVAFGNRNFNNFVLDNYTFLLDYLRKIMVQDTTTFVEKYYDWKDMKYKQINFKDVTINSLDSSGDLTDKFNFVIKHAEFLNNPFSKSGNARYSKIRRFKKQGVFKGRGKNLMLNEPYRSLLDVFNHYHCFDCWAKVIEEGEKAKAVLRLRPI